YIYNWYTTANSKAYTLSLHDALPISVNEGVEGVQRVPDPAAVKPGTSDMVAVPNTKRGERVAKPVAVSMELWPAYFHGFPTLEADRKSTRLNPSHVKTSYAVFCLKKK